MKKIVCALLLSSCLVAPALAAEADTAYGAIDFGTWSITPNAGGYPDTGALAFSVGYRISPRLAIEGGLAIAGQSVIQNFWGSWIYQQSAVKVAAVGTLPLSTNFSLFGKLGVAMVTGHLTGTGLYTGDYGSTTTGNLMFGLGAQVALSQHVGLRLQFERLGKSTYDPADPGVVATLSTLGVTFDF